jgi:hypothetical protein
MGNGNGNDSQQRIVINFIDPLFSVALGGSFAQVLAEPWFKNWWTIWDQPATVFAIATLVLLGYLTVVLSWVGYHQSIRNHPIKVETAAGRLRFTLDVVLLMIYFVLLVSYDNFARELWILAAIYFVFIIWDQQKRLEAKVASAEEKKVLQLRRGVTVFWFVAYFILASLYCFCPPPARFECRDWFVLLAAFSGTFLYRFHKEHRKPEWLLLFLGNPNA